MLLAVIGVSLSCDAMLQAPELHDEVAVSGHEALIDPSRFRFLHHKQTHAITVDLIY